MTTKLAQSPEITNTPDDDEETQADLWHEFRVCFNMIENDTYVNAKSIFQQLQDRFIIIRKP